MPDINIESEEGAQQKADTAQSNAESHADAEIESHRSNETHDTAQPPQPHDNEAHDRDFVDEGEAAAAAPVQSVNGETGDVEAGGAFELVEEGTWDDSDGDETIFDVPVDYPGMYILFSGSDGNSETFVTASGAVVLFTDEDGGTRDSTFGDDFTTSNAFVSVGDDSIEATTDAFNDTSGVYKVVKMS